MIATNPGRAAVRNRDMTAAWRHIDVALCGLVATTSILGALMIYSATRNKEASIPFIDKHIIFMVIGVAAMVAAASIDYIKLRDWARLLYVLGVLSLVGVLIPGVGSEHKGIRAWYDIGPFQIQPAEVTKVLVIIAVASYLGTSIEKLGPKQLITALVMFGVPMGLIMLQPDLGMVLIFVVVVMFMLLVGGVRGRFLLALAAIGILGSALVLNSSVLKQYQKDRLTAFVNPSADAQGTTYNVTQSQTAIGAGGVAGQGLFNGRQTQLRYVPEQQTDFIFTVVGEELGFVGASVLLLLYATVIWRIWRAAALARDRFGQLLCVGVLGFFVFQVFENVGMAMGIMPVTGIPLPFLSYGGTSILTSFIAVGLVLSVHMRRFR